MLTTGTILQNRYRIVSLLGQGGMGAVYRAWHLTLNMPLAIKEMVPQPGLDAQTLVQMRQQFQQEAAILAHLDHPNLVRVIDHFEEGGSVYLVMDFVEGESLADCIAREGALPEDEVLAWAGQLLDALDYCHGRGVIHRDVKPQNVILRPDGRAVLVDFGLVKLWDPDDPHTRTVMRGIGTPEYAPPEQYSTQAGHTGPHSDVYSLGAMLYHALTGQAPLTANDRMAALSSFPSVSDLNPQVSEETSTAVLRAIALPVPGRFGSATEMRAALKHEARTAGGMPAVAPSRPRPASKRQPVTGRPPTKVMPGAGAAVQLRRRVPGWVWVVGGVVVVALCAGLVLSALGGGLPMLAGIGAPTETPTRRPTQPLTVAPTATATELPTQAPVSTMVPRSTMPPAPVLGDTWIRPEDGMVMICVPPGEFQMGATGYSDSEPVHLVALDGFWIDRTEVTNVQYAQCVAAGRCEPPSRSRSSTRDSYYGDSAYDDYPVIYVSWYQARDYCIWARARLSTEAEWEYAARGPEGRKYPWEDGEPSCDLANYEGCAGDTVAAGSHPAGASWCGALDMAGNVWEWVGDWYGEYPSDRQENPAGPSSGEYRVMCGGGWDHSWGYVSAAYRRSNLPHVFFSSVGFRCVVSAGE